MKSIFVQKESRLSEAQNKEDFPTCEMGNENFNINKCFRDIISPLKLLLSVYKYIDSIQSIVLDEHTRLV